MVVVVTVFVVGGVWELGVFEVVLPPLVCVVCVVCVVFVVGAVVVVGTGDEVPRVVLVIPVE